MLHLSQSKSEGEEAISALVWTILTDFSVTRQDQYANVSRRKALTQIRTNFCIGCKKGGRECEFPQINSNSKRVKQSETRSPQETMKQESKEVAGSVLETIDDESENDTTRTKKHRRPTLTGVRTNSTQSVPRKHKHRQSQDASPTVKDKTSPQSTTSSSSQSRDQTPASSLQISARSAEIQARQAKIKTLRPELQKYLQYQHDHMTLYHYFFKLDNADFVHNEFIDQCLSYEPLLYAAVGFAAYHYEMNQESPKLSTFLKFYSKALSLLRKSLEHHPRYTAAVLLTVLQLATLEEYLGDWVNLIGHHRAAHTMLLQLYEPERMMESDLGRRIFSWYARIEIIAGIMGGNELQLSRTWFEANSAWYHSQIDTDPENDIDLGGIMADFISANRLLGYDVATLLARFAKQEISIEDFQREHDLMDSRLQALRAQLESLNDTFYAVQDFPVAKQRPLTDDDIVNPYLPGGLFKDVLFPLNFLWIDWYALQQLHVYQKSRIFNSSATEELEQLSLEQCRIYDAVDRWPDGPEGSILGAHASLAFAAVFLKKDEKHISWARRKFAQIERLGYVYPPKFRNQMAHMWGLTEEQVGEANSIEHWWLPNGEGLLPVLTDIRRVVHERHEGGEDQPNIGGKVEDVRDIRAIFAKLDIGNQSTSQSQASPSSTSTGSVPTSEETRETTQPPPTARVTQRNNVRSSDDVVDRMSGVWSHGD